LMSSSSIFPVQKCLIGSIFTCPALFLKSFYSNFSCLENCFTCMSSAYKAPDVLASSAESVGWFWLRYPSGIAPARFPADQQYTFPCFARFDHHDNYRSNVPKLQATIGVNKWFDRMAMVE
jgi:hypothetical protein